MNDGVKVLRKDSGLEQLARAEARNRDIVGDTSSIPEIEKLAPFSPGIAMGSEAWEWYQLGFCQEFAMSAIFARASFEQVTSVISEAKPSLKWHQEIAGRSIRIEHDKRSLPDVALVFRLRSWPNWTIVTGLVHPQAKTYPFDEAVGDLATSIHAGTKDDVVAVSCTGSLELIGGKKPIAIRFHGDWEDEGAPSSWLEERGIFMPPHYCMVDDSGEVQIWLAETPTDEVARMDIFC